ncbi:ribbon-helix-helix protein, CopG family [Ferrovibrio sp.]|uniref:ribbon-helix-helix protein, CopG family n=1 Tax=Ferrovibrio sp. TaxID=1917215 RepID=UPI0034169F99
MLASSSRSGGQSATLADAYTAVRLPAELKERLRRAAEREQLSMATLIRRALEACYGAPNRVIRRRYDRLQAEEITVARSLAAQLGRAGGLLKLALSRSGSADRVALGRVLEEVRKTGRVVRELVNLVGDREAGR